MMKVEKEKFNANSNYFNSRFDMFVDIVTLLNHKIIIEMSE